MPPSPFPAAGIFSESFQKLLPGKASAWLSLVQSASGFQNVQNIWLIRAPLILRMNSKTYVACISFRLMVEFVFFVFGTPVRICVLPLLLVELLYYSCFFSIRFVFVDIITATSSLGQSYIIMRSYYWYYYSIIFNLVTICHYYLFQY